jgi:LPXTG-motif cell wall-anchored protein
MLGGSTPRRWAAGLGVLAILGLNLVTAAPASAAETYGHVGAPPITIAKGSAGKVLAVSVYGYEAIDAVITVDVSGLVNIATATFPAACHVQGAKATCLSPVDGTYDYQIFVELKPLAGVAIGASGTVRYAIAAKDYSPGDSESSTVTIGSGFDLRVPVEFPAENPVAKTGDYVTAPLAVGNQGDESVSGIDVVVTYYREVIPVKYEQCSYTESATHYITAICSFDGAIAPGEFAEFVDENDKPIFSAQVDGDAMGTMRIFYEVFGKNEAPALAGKPLNLGGAAKSIHLRPKQAPQTAGAEVDDGDNWADFRWEVANQHDLAAAGAIGYGEVGDVVTLKLGINNVGAGSVDLWRAGGEDYANFWVRIPAGLELVETPPDCQMLPGYTFVCGSDGDYLAAGTTNLFDFKLKVHHPTNFTGEVALGTPAMSGAPAFEYDDENPANNHTSFQIILGSPPVAGPLPTTGSRASLLIGGGVMLVLVGALAFWLARRRRYPAV